MKNIVIFLLNKQSLGGIEQVSRNLENMLSLSNHVRSVKVVDLVGLKKQNSKLNEISLCKKFINELNDDTIILSLYDRLSLQLSFLKLLYGFKCHIVACQHADFFAHRKITRIFRRYLYKFIDKTVCLTQFDNDLYLKQGINSTLIPNSLSSYPEITIDYNNRADRVLAAGRLNKIKQFDNFIQLAQDCKYSTFSFELFGEGEEKHNLSQECEKLKLNSKNIIQGKTDFLYKELINSKFFIVTSQRESFSMVILEAMASGCVVISFDCPTGPRELITDGFNGFLVKQGDIESIKNRIMYLKENPSLAKVISHNAIENAFKYSSENILIKWEGLFDEL